MSQNYIQLAGWQQTLEKESMPQFDELMRVNEVLARSSDSYMQYCAAWAAMYASQKEHTRADEAYEVAASGFRSVAENPLVATYAWTRPDVTWRAEFAHGLAPNIRRPSEEYSTTERASVYQGFESIIGKMLMQAEKNPRDAIGVLGEFAVAALCWRPKPETFSHYNTVPAGPMKDNRQVKGFSTDLYAYHPTIVSTRKGRANLQVKATMPAGTATGYNKKNIVVVGVNDLLDTNNESPRSGYESVAMFARLLLQDIAGEPLAEPHEDMLFFAMADLYDRIHALADAKFENLSLDKKYKMLNTKPRQLGSKRPTKNLPR